ncbi:MAG: MerR family transcriptional regulator [Candidatus Omnitrophica bacterium]|nr:MerR family transcriptional regulator [Candidatus Omnitrophota bacterium]
MSDNIENFSKDKILKAGDLQDSIGLSYRQLNDWESKGLLPPREKNDAKWRVFSAKETFMLMILKEIRDKFGTPLESLNFIKTFMLQERANHFRFAIEMMQMGLTVYLLTDLKATFILDTDLEFYDLFKMGFLRFDKPQSYVFIKINPLVNRMLEMKKLGPLNVNNELYIGLHEAENAQKTTNVNEIEVLKLLRNKDYSQVTIQLKNGEIIQILAEEEILKKAEEIQKIIGEKAFQTVIIKKHGGEIVRLTRQIPFKMNKKGTEKT